MPDKASKKQLTLIHIAKAQLELSEEQYRATIRMKCDGKDSAAKLSYEEADGLIEHFKRLGFRIRMKAKSPCSAMCGPREKRARLAENVILFISPGQRHMIEHLKEDIRWAVWNGFDLWIKKYWGIDGGIRGIKYSIQATPIIEALKDMWRRQNKCACAITKGESHGG